MEQKEHNKNNTNKHQGALTTQLAILLGSIIIAGTLLFGMKNFMGNTSSNGFVDPDSIFSGRELKNEEFLIGKSGAKVILLEYSDLECPFCKKLHLDTMKDIEQKYASTVAFAYRHFPLDFHTKAPKEAEGALCARELGSQAKYKAFLDTIFEITPGNNQLDPKVLNETAKSLGLDEAKFAECLNSGKYAQQVKDDLQDGVDVGVQGTPHMLVLTKQSNGEYKILTTISGARDAKYVSKVLDQAIKLVK